MDRERVLASFHKFANKSTTRIPSASFPLALQELDIQVPPDKLQQLFKEADIDQDGGLDLEEFRRVIARPTELEQWCSTLPLAKLLGCCLEGTLADAATASPHAALADPVRRVCSLSPQDLDRVSEDFWGGVRRLLTEQASQLKRCYAELDSKAAEIGDGSNGKFQTFSMNAGTVEDFHKGLTDRVGTSSAYSTEFAGPQGGVFSRLTCILAAGEPNPNLFKGMADEHCLMYGHDEPFETSNYGVRTTPRQEYEITTGKRDCTAKNMEDRKGKLVRFIRRIEELKLLKAAQKAELVEEELIAVVRAGTIWTHVLHMNLVLLQLIKGPFTLSDHRCLSHLC
jgi:hypothetical protein